MPTPDDPWSFWVNVVSAAATLIALIVALVQIAKARKDLTKERERVFQLEVLRTLAQHTQGAEGFRSFNGVMVFPKDNVDRGSLFLLLPDDEPMPVWRAVVREAPVEIEAALAGKTDDLFPPSSATIVDALRQELQEAIKRRMKA